MPMSTRAYVGLKAAVEWNPTAAQLLLSIFKERPQWVKYKDDAYGPLGLILVSDVVNKPIFDRSNTQNKPSTISVFNNITVPAKLPPFPQEKLADCKIFGDEWKQRKITKTEVADTLEKILLELQLGKQK